MKFDDKPFPVHEWISNDLAQGHLVTGLLVRVFVFAFTSYHSQTKPSFSTCLSQFIFILPIANAKRVVNFFFLFAIVNCSREPDLIESELIFLLIRLQIVQFISRCHGVKPRYFYFQRSFFSTNCALLHQKWKIWQESK